jgi:hypothetical protein
MDIGSSTPLHRLLPVKECFSINDVRTLVAKQLQEQIQIVGDLIRHLNTERGRQHRDHATSREKRNLVKG